MSVAEFVYGDVPANTSTYGLLSVFGYVYGNVALGDTDWFKTYLVAGRTYTFEMFDFNWTAYEADYPFDSLLTLHNAGGSLVATGSEDLTGFADDSLLNFSPSTSGIYYLSASGFQGATGSYFLTMDTDGGDDDIPEDSTTTRSLTTSNPVSSKIEVASDVDWIRVSLLANTAYTVNANFTAPLGTPDLYLFDADGYFVNQIEPGQPFFAPATGSYFLEVGDQYLNTAGNYTVSLKSTPTLSIDQPVAGEGETSIKFTIKLSEASSTAITFVASTVDDSTATAGVDYIAKSQALTILPGRSSATFTVSLKPDSVFEPTEQVVVRLTSIVGATASEGGFGGGFVFDNDQGSNSLPADGYVTYQWHLYPTTGANVLPVWNDYTGRGIKIGVFDQGIDRTHPDLDGNLLTNSGRDSGTLAKGGDPKNANDNHGTMVAGVIAAERNGIDGVGVAYGADLVSIYQPLGSAAESPNEIVNAFTYALGLDVLNNSWGFASQVKQASLEAPWAFYDNFLTSAFADEGAALKRLADEGRGGLGTVVVQSAGNSYRVGDDTNLHNFQNSRYVITVGATDYRGDAARYSSPGASVLVTGPGGGGDDNLSDIWTTDRVGNAGNDAGNFTATNGTSFSAPVVSGIVALLLEANPGLGYRDVQTILAYSASITSRDSNEWEFNGTTDWNGGGLHYDAVFHDLGFGLVDARAAVRLAESWQTPAATSSNDVEVSAGRSQPTAIPDDSLAGVTQSVTINQPLQVERAEVTVHIDHPFIGDLGLMLTSPSGTQSFLVWRAGQNPLSAYGSDQADIDFNFDTVLSLGESSIGRWDLTVFDLEAGAVGTLQSWTLNLVGKPETDDDLYVYSDEFSDVVSSDAQRATLSDSGGNDMINASMLTSKVVIDLNPGASSTIDGKTLKLASGTSIENAWGGDGADQLSGNGDANRLFGGRGNDSLFGRSGNDTLGGGPGNDTLECGAGVDTVRFIGDRKSFTLTNTANGWIIEDKSGQQGKDSVSDWERIEFSDIGVAYDVEGNAGYAAQIIRALFGKAYLSEEAIVGIGIQLLDLGVSYSDLVNAAIATPAFEQLAGGRDNDSFATHILNNVFGFASQADVDYLSGLLDAHVFTQEALGLAACQIDANTQSAELVGLAVTGIEYLPADQG